MSDSAVDPARGQVSSASSPGAATLSATPADTVSNDNSRLRVVSVNPDTLVLVRRRANGVGSEGLVVDSRELVRSLKAQVLEARGLDEVADLRASNSFGRSAEHRPGYVFSQSFAAPFESLKASLQLRPLADPTEGNFVLPVSLVLGLSLVAGLFALYRMAATQVRFAERRSNFVAAVSHELKTPLTAIRMHVEMLEQDLVEGEAKRREYYRTITREGERLSRLIDNVLVFSQIEHGVRRLQLVMGDIRPCLRESIETLTPHAEAHGFALQLEVPSELPAVCFEPDALKQVLFNLVENALKYAGHGADRRISVSVAAHGSGVALCVRDRGPGVAPAHLKQVFDAFFRGEDELTRRSQGTGIGLSLVKGLAFAMGAQVYAENAEPGFRVRVLLSTSPT